MASGSFRHTIKQRQIDHLMEIVTILLQQDKVTAPKLARHFAAPDKKFCGVSGGNQKLRFFMMNLLLGKIGDQFLRRIPHPPPEPDLDPAVQEESDIGGGLSGGHLLLRIEAAQIQDDVFEQIDQPSFV